MRILPCQRTPCFVPARGQLPVPHRGVVASQRRGAVRAAASRGPDVSEREAVQAIHRERERLQLQLEDCIKREDYSRAAKLKQELQDLDELSPVLRVQRELERAVREERFEDAARLQKELQELLSDPSVPLDLAAVSTTSDCLSPPGIRVRVRSFYMPAHSAPDRSQWMFAYNITVINESDKIVQLKDRHWIITDETGNREEVKGPGVVGQQPVLLPGKSFSYNSGCPLSTENGTMEGEYGFLTLDEADGLFKDPFTVKVARFKLTTQGEAIA